MGTTTVLIGEPYANLVCDTPCCSDIEPPVRADDQRGSDSRLTVPRLEQEDIPRYHWIRTLLAT
jgi:hypothetical protein